MRDTIADVLRALFVTEGRLVGVKSILALMTIFTVCLLALDGYDNAKDAVILMAVGFGGIYTGASIAKGRG